ncbi:MAG: hypothetical protein HC913_21560 [Microscillaceae bacterium]|nr:hypothetical protein [Microscillaceae bacterium]
MPWAFTLLPRLPVSTARDVEQVTRAIAFFPGRIERDHWIDQAKSLAQGHQAS